MKRKIITFIETVGAKRYTFFADQITFMSFHEGRIKIHHSQNIITDLECPLNSYEILAGFINNPESNMIKFLDGRSV